MTGRVLLLVALLAVAPACSGQEEAVGERPAAQAGEGDTPADATPTDAAGAAEEKTAAWSKQSEVGTETADPDPPPLRRLAVEVVESYPHDRQAFTQGLLLEAPGVLLESTGRYGQSELRRVDLASGEVMRRQALPDEVFGEGLALVPGDGAGGDGAGGDGAGSDGGEARLVQLTWRAGRALVWDAATFQRRGEHSYPGEGWGLCHMAESDRLVMSDGSHRLFFRDPETFAPIGEVEVTLEGRPLGYLNELECVGGRVWANVLGLRQLFEVDPADGRVVAVADVGRLLTPEEAAGTDVMNGIAHDPADGTFLLTGKLWPKLFRVRLVEE